MGWLLSTLLAVPGTPICCTYRPLVVDQRTSWVYECVCVWGGVSVCLQLSGLSPGVEGIKW